MYGSDLSNIYQGQLHEKLIFLKVMKILMAISIFKSMVTIMCHQ
jgi:hypothetical protein